MTETVNPEPRGIKWIIPLLAIATIGLYNGRGVLFHYGSILSGGIGGIAVLIGGGDQQTAREIAQGAVHPMPGLEQQIAFGLFIVSVVLLNVIIWTGGRQGTYSGGSDEH